MAGRTELATLDAADPPAGSCDRFALPEAVAFRHPCAHAIMPARIARRVSGDVRAPVTLRFGHAPLYLLNADLWDAAATLRDVGQSGAWQLTAFQQRQPVT